LNRQDFHETCDQSDKTRKLAEQLPQKFTQVCV